MKLFVANATAQDLSFLYRLPERQQVINQKIAAGSQVRLSGDFDSKTIDYIVQQHVKYGMVPADEAKRHRGFAGTCYSIDDPVQIESIQLLIQQNVQFLDERGAEIRMAAGVAAHESVSQSGARLAALNLEVVEQDGRDGRQATFAKGVRVDTRSNPDGTPKAA